MAWDGTTLAGDTLGVIGDSLKVHSVKIYRLADGRLYGGSGTYEDVLAVLAWLNEGGDKPRVENFAALLIDTEGQCARLEGGLRPMPIREPFHSVGSGRDFAIAAMALGKTAADAVALAMQFDPWTGGQVQTLRLAHQPLAHCAEGPCPMCGMHFAVPTETPCLLPPEYWQRVAMGEEPIHRLSPEEEQALATFQRECAASIAPGLRSFVASHGPQDWSPHVSR